MTQNKKKQTNSNKTKSNKNMKLLLASGLAIIIIIGIVLSTIGKGSKQDTRSGQLGTTDSKLAANNNQSNTVQAQADGDLVIPIASVTAKASFYDYNVGGTKLQVIAIKAPDGTIRTAFNTCQVCYSSGKGYYVQQGEYLVCQNCKNKFLANQVEISKGGCNPVAIFNEDKTVDATNITITKSFLEKSKAMFANWKS